MLKFQRKSWVKSLNTTPLPPQRQEEMKPTQSINYRYITIFFIGFFLLAVIGFWNSYFTKIFTQENYRMHTHGIALDFVAYLAYHSALFDTGQKSTTSQNTWKIFVPAGTDISTHHARLTEIQPIKIGAVGKHRLLFRGTGGQCVDCLFDSLRIGHLP